MKKVNLFLDNDQYELLKKAKGKKSWVEFVMELVKKK